MADGGGLQVAVPLTADLVARAVIAAARAYGDDPVSACVSDKRFGRRSLSAAAGGLARALDQPATQMCRVLGVNPKLVGVQRSQSRGVWSTAETAAMRAVTFALWRPEARESVAGGAAVDDVPAGAADGNLERLRKAVRSATPAKTVEAPAPPTPESVAAPVARAVARRPGLADQLKAAERPVGDLVLEALADGEARDTLSLASMIDRKELAVVSALSALKCAGQVADEASGGGPRRFKWRLVR